MPQAATLPRMAAPSPLSLRRLLDALRPHESRRMVFSYDGRDTSPGFHVTELEYGQFAGLDCGANPESWAEIFVLLWDIAPEPGKPPMTAGKFVAIMRKFAKSVPFDTDAKLTFEVSDSMRATQLFTATDVEEDADALRVALARVPSSCKPRDRWLEAEKAQAQAAACCAPKAEKACCG